MVTEGLHDGHESDVSSIALTVMNAESVDFVALYRDGVERVWRLLSRLGIRSADVEDAVQDVFVVAHRRLDSLKPNVAPAAWLAGIAVRVAHDYRRSALRKPTESIEAAADVIDGAVAPDELAMRRDVVGFTLRLLDNMDPAQRDIFVLTEFEQLSAPEIAAAMSIPLNTVYSRLRLARARFNELVAGQETVHD